jgi:DNA-binding transcriptional ArsR family regulator
MVALSHHLAVPRLTGLVEVRRDGQRHTCALTDVGRTMRGAVEALGG